VTVSQTRARLLMLDDRVGRGTGALTDDGGVSGLDGEPGTRTCDN